MRIPRLGFVRQRAAELEKHLVMTGDASERPSLEHRILRRGERQSAGLNHNEQRREVVVRVGSTVEAGRANRERTLMGLLKKLRARKAAVNLTFGHETDHMLSQR